MKADEIAPLILPLAIVAGGGLLLYKFGLLDFRSGNEKVKEKDEDITKIKVEASKLRYPLASYKSIADNTYREINSLLVTKDSVLLDLIRDLNGYELRQVYKDFGKRCDSYTPGPALPGDWTFCVGSKHDLFWWYEKTMSGNDLKEMKKEWSIATLGWK